MSLKRDLARNYLDRLLDFDPSEESVQVLESARRFIRDYTGKAVDPEIRSIINQIHDRLEEVVVECANRTDIKPSFTELVRKYDGENQLASERVAPTIAPISEDRLRLVPNYEYDPALYDASTDSKDPRRYQSQPGDPGGDPKGGEGGPTGPQEDLQEGQQEASGF